jgi:hypothetical protein
MKRLGSIVFISAVASALALGGCENTSRLDKQTGAERGVGAGGGDKAPGAVKADHSGSVEDRLTRLENSNAKYGETLEWVNGIREQQKAQAKAQAEQRQRDEPDPDAVFAVDVAPDVKIGAVEGPNTALVTIVEAWDFA